MKRLYLIRHGKPDFSQFKKEGTICISDSDLSLGDVGKLQAVLLEKTLQDLNVNFDRVYCSNLKRTKETAAHLHKPVIIDKRYREMGVGAWEGLSFEEIKRDYKELYEKRGEDPFNVVPPGGELPKDCINRMKEGIIDAVKETKDRDCVIITHSMAMRLFLTYITEGDKNNFMKIKLPYSAVFAFDVEEEKISFAFMRENNPTLDRETILKMQKALGVDEKIIRHEMAVAGYSKNLLEKLERTGNLDNNLIVNAALLHDILKGTPLHDKRGAKLILDLGYNEVAKLIESHMELSQEDMRVCPSAVLFYADKRIKGENEVSIEERFANKDGFKEKEARVAANRRYKQAKQLEEMFEAIL